MSRRTRAAVGILAGTAGILAGGPDPAGATPLRDVDYTDTDLSWDLGGSGHTLCATCTVRQGGMVTAWQRYLYADGFLDACGSTGVDGYYGGVTAYANGAWEAAILGSSSADGVADNWFMAGASTLKSPGSRWRYSGEDHTVAFVRPGGSGAPYKIDFSGEHPTDHPDRGTFPYC